MYKADALSSLSDDEFRKFVLDCYDARIPSDDVGIHGYKGSRARVPVWVGPPSRVASVTVDDVWEFARAVSRLASYQSDDGLREAVMLAWGFTPGAVNAAAELREREQARMAFVRLDQITLESREFRHHIESQATNRQDYSQFLTFVEPPEVVVEHRRVGGLRLRFSAAGTRLFNPDAKIANVQWDFDHDGETFRAARGEWFHRTGKGGAPVPRWQRGVFAK